MPGISKGGSITVPLTSCLTGLDQSVLQKETKIVSCHTANCKPVKQEVSCTVILSPQVFLVYASRDWGTLVIFYETCFWAVKVNYTTRIVDRQN